ncbi:hypothetical protein PIB30_010056 [Stylosanthes scabra]|uniref:Clp R domain-containing protein n=1 Tax=Stylosanthes scabra TaxID=79078 RepID=A0ABU6W3F4_9FABA|nr:hypothetical protein [Stylosanthes scabra]
MRSGGCTLQQTLTAEAASVLKHALVLARRRGHAQVTPLHVAATLLSLRASSLRRACLISQFPNHHQQPQNNHHHPLHCRALELCFNVALNRLPTTTPTPPNFLTVNPSLSNALIAALKRAQAHQRRGCIEQQQQQPLLAIKVELDQLIISILDDPSVSRVMREAGFSSTAVKSNLEDSSSSSATSNTASSAGGGPCSVFYGGGGGVFSSPCSPRRERESIFNNSNAFSTLRQSLKHQHQQHHFLGGGSSEYFPSSVLLFSPQQKKVYPTSEWSCNKEDMRVVLDALLRKNNNKKRNTVIVGDSLSMSEAVMAELMVKVERGDVPEELKNTELIKFQFSGVSRMKREEVEMSLSALKRKVDSITSTPGSGGGAIFYVGDLKWTVEGEGEGGCYKPVEHVVEEIGKLFSEKNSNKVWLMGTASYQTYIKCQRREPPLENHWALQPVPVPSSATLALTLQATSSVYDSNMMSMPHQNPSHMFDTKHLSENKKEGEEEEKLNCCEECASNYEKEAQLFKPGHKKLLPSWLQTHITEPHQKDELGELKKKWNRLCNCVHHSKQLDGPYGNNNNAKIFPYNSSYPWWPNQITLLPDSNSSSISFADPVLPYHHNSNNNYSHLAPRFRRQQSCSTIEFNFTEVTQRKQESTTTSATLDNQELKISLALGNSAFSDYDGSGQTLVLQSRAHVCKVLQENVPWQSETLPSIAEALVELDSATTTKKQWFLLQGNDSVGKTRLARAIAESVFGFGLVDNHDDVFLHLDMKKVKNSSATVFPEVLATSLRTKEKIVVLIEDFDLSDSWFKKLVADEFEASKFGNSSKKDENLKQAIFILTSGGDEEIKYKDKDMDSSVMNLVLKIETKASTMDSSSSWLSPDYYLCHKKRRAHELDLFAKSNKSPRIEEKDENLLLEEQVNKKKDFSRQSSFNTLDLNMKADEENYDDGEDESSPVSSDLTRDTMAENINSNGFLESIENRFQFNQSPARLKEKEELFLNKIKKSFDEVFERKKKKVKFNVDEKVIEEIGVGCGNFTNSMFEKWLKDIFQNKLLETVVNCDHGKEGIVFNITLCLGGGNGKGYNSKFDNSSGGGAGFMSSCLPKNIQINYFMD